MHHIGLFRRGGHGAEAGRTAVGGIPHAGRGVGSRIPGAAVLVPIVKVQVGDGARRNRGEVHLARFLFLVRLYTESICRRSLQSIEFRTEGGGGIVAAHRSAVVRPGAVPRFLPLEAQAGRTSLREPAAIQDGEFRPRLHGSCLCLHRRRHGKHHRGGTVAVAHVNQIQGQVIVAHGQRSQEGAQVQGRFRFPVMQGRHAQAQGLQALYRSIGGIHQLHVLRQARFRERGFAVAHRQGLDAPGRTEIHHIATAGIAFFHGYSPGQVNVLSADGRQAFPGEIQVELIFFLVHGIIHQHAQQRGAGLRTGFVKGEFEVVMLPRLHGLNRDRSHPVRRALGIHHIQVPFQGRCLQISLFGEIAVCGAENQCVAVFVGNGHPVLGKKVGCFGIELHRDHGTGQRGGQGGFREPVGTDGHLRFRFIAGRFPALARVRAGNGLDGVVARGQSHRGVGQRAVIGHPDGFTASRRNNLQRKGRVGLTGLGLHHRRHRQVGGQPHGKEAFLLRQVRLARAGYQRQHREKAKRVSHRATRHRIRQVSPGSGPCCPSPSG